MNSDTANSLTETQIITLTKAWLTEAVIGLNLCPFAKSVYINDRIHYQVSSATDAASLLNDLILAMQHLAFTDAKKIDTTLLIHPLVLQDFLDYNDFLDLADAALHQQGLDGTLQIASFHPQYQFADTQPDDVTNCSNRSPFPVLHLLREDSLDKAIAAVTDTADIFNRNIDTLKTLGTDGWQQLQLRIHNKS